jgi:hypothetical protein
MNSKLCTVLLCWSLIGLGLADISVAKTAKTPKSKDRGVVKTLSKTGHDAKDTLSGVGHGAKDTLETTGHDAKNTLHRAGNVPYRALKGFFTGK